MANETVLSWCPFCGARGVKRFEPLFIDGHQCDVPYCGKCGKSYPADTQPETPRDTVSPFPRDHR